jgi:protoporphyrinogen oxidase
VWNAVLPSGRNSTDVTSLIEQFQYPKYGPGMMWEACAAGVTSAGADLRMQVAVERIERTESGVTVHLTDGSSIAANAIISSMAINELIKVLDPPAPTEVLTAADRLKHRDFLTVALVIPEEDAFPDNWIYIHSPTARVGRVQNYGSWSPFLVKEGRTCLGMEYFVSVGDDIWEMPDDDLIMLAQRELEGLGLAKAQAVEEGYVVRYPKTYPVYDGDYAHALGVLRQYLEAEWPEIHPVGRNGMHRYNNQDHSMLTAMFTADNIALGASHDVWSVNVEEDYHEESKSDATSAGTGRAAPVTS